VYNFNIKYKKGAIMTHVQVSVETRDKLKELRKENGLASMDEVIKRLVNKCSKKIS
jgi:hypothetical protein